MCEEKGHCKENTKEDHECDCCNKKKESKEDN